MAFLSRTRPGWPPRVGASLFLVNPRPVRGPQAQIFGACCFRNFLQPGDDPQLRCGRVYLATVLADTLNPNLANSAWIRF
jgi:hypothetical protein